MPSYREIAFFCALFLGLQLAIPAAAEQGPPRDWPQFRGPRRDGVSAEKGLLAEWPKTGPERLWKVPIGTGYSGLAVASGKLFTMFAEGAEEFAAGFDAATGQELWRVSIDARFRDAHGDGPRSTPATDGDAVYVLSSYGLLAALRAADGSVLWKVDFRERFGSHVPRRGYSTSPMLDGGVLVAVTGGGKKEAHAAFDRATGRVLWTSQDGGENYSSPIAVTIGTTRQYVFVNDQVVGLSPDGKFAWRYPWIPESTIAMPVFVAPDRIFVSAADAGGGAALLRIREDGVRLVVEELWRNRTLKNHFSSSVAFDGHLYGFDGTILLCVRVESGEPCWRQRGFGEGSLLAADGRLIVLSDRGQLVLAEASPTGFREKGRVQALKGKSWTAPSLAAGTLYLRNQTQMTAFSFRAPVRWTSDVSTELDEAGTHPSRHRGRNRKQERLALRRLQLRQFPHRLVERFKVPALLVE